MPCASQPRVGSGRAKRRRPKNAIRRTSSRERVEQRNRKLALLPPSARRKSCRPNLPSTGARGSKSSKNGKPNGGFLTRSEKNASGNKKSIEAKSNGSVKSANASRNSNASVVCAHKKNGSKSASGVCSGIRRSNVSENDVLHASKNEWLALRQQQRPHHRPCPQYSLINTLSCRFPSQLSSVPTREKRRTQASRKASIGVGMVEKCSLRTMLYK